MKMKYQYHCQKTFSIGTHEFELNFTCDISFIVAVVCLVAIITILTISSI